MKLKDLVAQHKIKLSVTPAGTFFSGLEPFNSSNDINLLVLDSVVRTKNGIMLASEKVMVHIYGEKTLLQKVEAELQKSIGKNWNDIREVDI